MRKAASILWLALFLLTLMTTTVTCPSTVIPTSNRGKVFFPNLDGLRFFAFLSVFLFHSFYTPDATVQAHPVYKFFYSITRQGALGVNFFFVLSGFLITYLLLSEKQLNGRIAIKAFYLRRILRIWPLYYLVVLLGFVVFPWLKANFGVNPLHEPAQPIYFLFFLSNFNNLYHGSDTPTLTLLWSVSIEEQFYVIWPLLVAVVPIKRMAWLFGGVIVVSAIFRVYNIDNEQVMHLHTLSVISDMAMGGFFAWLCFRNERFINKIERMPRSLIVAIYAVGIALIYGQPVLHTLPGFPAFDRVFLSLFFAFIILEQNYARHSIVKMTHWRFVTRWGTYTYGLYCLHFLALLAAYQISRRLGLNNSVYGVVVVDNVLGLAIALSVSWLSFHFYEKPFLKLKERFAYTGRG